MGDKQREKKDRKKGRVGKRLIGGDHEREKERERDWGLREIERKIGTGERVRETRIGESETGVVERERQELEREREKVKRETGAVKRERERERESRRE